MQMNKLGRLTPMKKPLQTLLTVLAIFSALVSSVAAQTAAGPKLASQFPANHAKDICPDTHLTLTFDSPSYELGNTGEIRIYDAANDQLVDTVDTSIPASEQEYTLGAGPSFRFYPVLPNGRDAIIYPHEHKLEYNKTYYVQIDAGVLKNASGPFSGFSGKTAWVFTTKAAPPSKDATRLVVAADSTGDFATVQGAIDFTPDQSTQRITIFIRKGLYPEIVYFERKSNLTFLGEDRKQTVIGYPNNDRFSNRPPTVRAYHRGLFFANNSNGIHLVNLTLKNSTPKGGSQAESIIMTGSQNILSHVDLSSLQDTLQINGSAYVADCYIEGDVDFMWGRGPVFFENCELKALNKGYFTQIRNTNANHGYVYDHCILSTTPNAAGTYLSRIDPNTFPYSEVVLLDCALGEQIIPAGWLLNNGPNNGPQTADAAPNVQFWEYHSTNISDGKPVDVSARAAFSKQLTMENDAETIKNYRDPNYVLGWAPTMAPIITQAPARQSIKPAQKVEFSVTAAAIPAPTYQWQHNGVALKDGGNISGVTTGTLTIANPQSSDAGSYSVVITNPSGNVTSTTEAN